MRLISLEINGFKSFAQKTKIEFMPGMTGIVGPNGSGKSNIIEAVRWVMGEQSAKDLRGGKMTDVIFAGSADRKPLSRAEVSITFDNSDHYINSEFNEIRVTRQLYRNGDSRYLINGAESRLKDVVDLFMDSGLGRESFSIISQGRVESIFNGKPADRRKVIEEVAGVSKYKKNKDTAEKRLGDTQDNLQRVNDILGELESQVEPLAEQSALAKEYQEQKLQFDHLDKTKTVLDIQQNQTKLAQLQERVQNAQAMSAQYDEQLAQITHANSEMTSQQTRLTISKDELQANLLTATQTIANLQNQQNLNQERATNRAANLDQINARRQALEEIINELQADLQQLKLEQDSQREAIHSNEDDLAKLKALSVSEREQQLADRIEKLQAAQVDLMQQLTTIHNQKTFMVRNHEQDSQKQHQASIDLTESQTKYQTATAQLIAITDELDRKQQSQAELRAKFETERQRHTELQSQYDAAQQSWYQALSSEQTVQAKINSLKSLEADYAGFYQGVRYTLQHRQQFAGLLGPVSELIEVPDNYTQAIETVLSGQLQNLVVNSQTDGKAIINYLVKKRAGRVTILPLDSIAVHSINHQILQQITDQPGFEGVASDLVTAADAVMPMVQHLLGTTVIADTLDHATQISKLGQHRIRVVTIDGQLINASGSMTGGANKQQRQGLLSRQQEQDQLTTQLSELTAKTTSLEEQVAKFDTAVKASQQAGTQLQQLIEDATTEVQQVQGRLTIATNEKQVLEKRIKALEFEVNQTNDEHASFADQMEHNEQKEHTLSNEIERTKSEISQTKQDLADLQADESVQARQIQEREQWLAVASEKMSQISRNVTEKQTEIDRQQAQFEQLTAQTVQNQQTSAEQQSNRDQLANQLAEAEAQRQSDEQQMTELTTKLTQLGEQIEAGSDQQRRLQDLQRAALEELNDVNQRNARLETLVDQGMNRLSERYAMSLEEAQQDLVDIPLKQIETQLMLLKRGLDEIGTVNLGAIDEYERVSKRYDFLKEQQTDLLRSKDQLRETMSEMDEEVKTRFEASFNEIAVQFERIFVEMFGGGRAKLILTDPEDMLTTGVDIIAQPPGKKNQQMSLLSGGERALTAITLLFSILAVRPVPFAILDETEAALDDANVSRFARYMSTYGDDGPQFIVVTHRKGTMMNAKVLYGVTMQESGVSKMVSVSLEDVKVTE